MSESLSIYLHDHLSAADFAVELLEHWNDATLEDNFGTFVSQLGVEVERDRETLRQIIERVGKSPHTLKEAAGWLAEKASRIKLGSKQEAGGLPRLEALEMLALGILGKRALWKVLREISVSDVRLRDFDFEVLAASAIDQHARTELQRLQAARLVFRPDAISDLLPAP